MKKKEKSLTITQLQFSNYIKSNLDDENRIIFFKHCGHFGIEYTVSSTIKNAEIFHLSQLKQKKGKNILFRLFNITLAIFTFFLKVTKDIDSENSVFTILNNMENIYLGIDKEKEFLKYLHIKKCSHKYRNIRYVIRVEEQDINSTEDIQTLKLLCNLIKGKKINNTLLLISGNNLIQLLHQFINSDTRIPFFQLTEEDIIHIVNENALNTIGSIEKHVKLVKSLGLAFFLEHYMYFSALTKVETDLVDWMKQVEWIINIIIKENISEEAMRNQLFPLLEFSSFFNDKFSKTEIMNFHDNLLAAQNLDLAYQLAIIQQISSSIYAVPTYRYEIDAFKHFFVKRYSTDLNPLPQYIFKYFREYYPFEYIPAIKILQADASFISYSQKQSLILIGYYYENITKGIINSREFIRCTPQDSTARHIIVTYEAFRNNKNISEESIILILKGIRNNYLDNIASCSGYTIILQLLKENYIHFPNINFSEILKELASSIIRINTQNNYDLYWKMYFMCEYIALYLEDEETNGSTARKFQRDVKKLQEDEGFIAFINENNLRGFSRIDLLSFSLGYDNAGELLKKLYYSSESSTVLKELARINYSAYLIENELFYDAEKILKKGNKNFLKNINVDTYGGYLNNLYLSQYKNRTININEFIIYVQELVCENISTNDKLIIENNLCIAYLKLPSLAYKGEKRLREILKEGNPVNWKSKFQFQ